VTVASAFNVGVEKDRAGSRGCGRGLTASSGTHESFKVRHGRIASFIETARLVGARVAADSAGGGQGASFAWGSPRCPGAPRQRLAEHGSAPGETFRSIAQAGPDFRSSRRSLLALIGPIRGALRVAVRTGECGDTSPLENGNMLPHSTHRLPAAGNRRRPGALTGSGSGVAWAKAPMAGCRGVCD
jgi:hypothetical protein